MLTLAILFLIHASASRPISYIDPEGRRPTGYQEYAARQTDAPFQSQVVRQIRLPSPVFRLPPNDGPRPTDDGHGQRLVVVFVNSGLYPAIQSKMDTWLSDVAAAGYSTKVIACQGGRAKDLRQVLQANQDSGLVGTVMVGAVVLV